MRVEFDDYLADLPLLHSWDGGVTWNTGGFSAEQLRALHDFLAGHLPQRPTVLETGAGNSTICLRFLAPARQVSICPSPELFDRIDAYLRAHDLPSDLERHVGLSEWVLPDLAGATRDAQPVLDFGLLDGGHGWPTVHVDFFYVNFMLRRGGYLMIDDLQLHSVKELGRLLAEQPGYELALDMRKFLIFRKTTDRRTLPDWVGEPYIVRRSDAHKRSADPFAL